MVCHLVSLQKCLCVLIALQLNGTPMGGKRPPYHRDGVDLGLMVDKEQLSPLSQAGMLWIT